MTQPLSSNPPTELHCARHPQTITYLRCGKCDTPICPQCLVHTPVGARCPDCAQLRALPQFQVHPLDYAKATAAALGVSVLAGVVWAIMPFGGFLGFFLALGSGYAVAEAINQVTNRREDLGLKIIAGGGVVIAAIVARMAAIVIAFGAATGGNLSVLLPLALGAGIASLLNPLTLAMVAVGALFAASRIG